jgi:hypothetical protein
MNKYLLRKKIRGITFWASLVITRSSGRKPRNVFKTTTINHQTERGFVLYDTDIISIQGEKMFFKKLVVTQSSKFLLLRTTRI